MIQQLLQMVGPAVATQAFKVRLEMKEGSSASDVSFTNSCFACAVAAAIRAMFRGQNDHEIAHLIAELHRRGVIVRHGASEEGIPKGVAELTNNFIDSALALEAAWAKHGRIEAQKEAAKARGEKAPDGPWQVLLCRHGIEKGCFLLCQCGHTCKDHDALAGCTAAHCDCPDFVNKE